ncbi:MAG: TldD/PmbA family protein [Bacteroidales bacterium]|nr:TldD/PmbA family protein [Bacteroidales bacterium]
MNKDIQTASPLLTAQETDFARASLEQALRLGAQHVRITLNKSRADTYGTLNGSLDKVTRNVDRAMTVSLFADGRFGSFSTNRLQEGQIRSFLEQSVAMVRMMAPDPCRFLPDPARTEKQAQTGTELGLYDPACTRIDGDEKRETALAVSVFGRFSAEGLISEEGEYSDSVADTLILDSNGLCCRHCETSFEYGVEATVQDTDGNRYSDYWWEAAPQRADLAAGGCAEKAFRLAKAQQRPRRIASGKYNLVLDTECAGKLVAPVINALNGYAIQQKNSFLLDKLGEKVFSDKLVIVDAARQAGASGSRLFDSEGVATQEGPVIDHGVIRKYFLNTYMAAKLQMAPTVEDITRPLLLPVGPAADRASILRESGEGVLVTGFNGGNSNAATGNFSFGVDGFYFRGGEIVHPVREMLITGNFTDLWNHLLLAGSDVRRAHTRLIPTLAFEGVDFSA